MYERKWAEEVYGNFYAEHVLAAREINEMYKISVEAVIIAIQQGSERWRGYKSLVKHLEKAAGIYWKHYHTLADRSKNHLTFVKYCRTQFRKRMFPAPLDLVDTTLDQDLPW